MLRIILATSIVLSAASLAFGEDATLQLKLVAQNGKFEPAELKAPANKRIELMVENKGPGAEEFESKDLKREKVIPAGQTVKITLGTLKKGVYKFFGDYHQETAQGKLTVE